MAWILVIFGVFLVVGGILFLMFYYPKNTQSTVDRAQNLSQDKYDPNMTRYAAAKEAKAAQARFELLTNVNLEIGAITETIDREAAALQAGYRKEDAHLVYATQREKEAFDHQAYIALADNKRIVADMASNLGLDPDTVRELILEETRTKREILLEEVKMKALLEMKAKEVELEIIKHKQFKEIDFHFEERTANLDLRMADVANMLPQHILNQLHTQLSSINSEYDHIKGLPEGEFKEKELVRITKKLKAWEREIDERTGLFEGADGEEQE